MIKTWSTPATVQEERPIPCVLCGGSRFKKHFSYGDFRYVRCTICGLVQINPQPVPAAVRDRYGADYLSYERANETAFLRLQELALKDAGFFDDLEDYLTVREPPAVLDIGCATGALLSSLREKGWQVTGVEISRPQAEYARRERNLDVRTRPLEENRFPPDSFRAVLASHLIEHLNDPASLVREVYRILLPGGCFYVTTPNIAGFQARLLGKRWRSAIFDHLYLFSAKTLPALLRRNGFTVEKTVTWGGLAAGLAPPRIKAWADRAAKKLNRGDVMIVRARKPNEKFAGLYPHVEQPPQVRPFPNQDFRQNASGSESSGFIPLHVPTGVF
ncbi:MAG: class I SAM-dependent methyltransferase [Treponema sp.]|nr:class I SAM-dependent methyltransferase [Treponema sp.]